MTRFRRLFRRNFFLSKTEGFTLIEIIVVISITIILSVVVLAYNHSSEKQIVLYRDQAAIVSVLNQAKSLAIQKFNQPESGYIACAFGVHFQSDGNYFLYQDLVSGASCPRSRNYSYNANSTLEKIQSFSLDSRLRFVGLPGTGLDIAFIAPELIVTSTQPLPVNIPLQTFDGSILAPIQVSFGGQIVSR